MGGAGLSVGVEAARRRGWDSEKGEAGETTESERANEGWWVVLGFKKGGQEYAKDGGGNGALEQVVACWGGAACRDAG